jgi:putative tricarboxylic transport membrane protein
MNSNLISGVLFLLLSLIIWFLIPLEIQILEGSSSLNAQTLPKMVTGTMLFLSVILLIQGVFFTKQENHTKTNKKESVKSELNVLVMIVIFWDMH